MNEINSTTQPPAPNTSNRSRRKYDAIATIRTYKDKATGEEKKVRQKVGTVFESPNGNLSLKLDVLPIGPGWSGFISFYPPGERGNENERSPGSEQSSHDPHSSTGQHPPASAPSSAAHSTTTSSAHQKPHHSGDSDKPAINISPPITLPPGGPLRILPNKSPRPAYPSPGPKQGYQNGAPPPPIPAGTDEEEDDIPF